MSIFHCRYFTPGAPKMQQAPRVFPTNFPCLRFFESGLQFRSLSAKMMLSRDPDRTVRLLAEKRAVTMQFHEKLQELRKKKGLTQEELAQALYVSRTAVSKWESGRGLPGIESLKAIAKYFSVTIDDLLSGGELLTIAEEEQKQKESHLRDLVLGLLDCSAAGLLFLPLFGETAGGHIAAVPLLALTGAAPYLKITYYIVVVSMILWGLLTLTLQNCRAACWVRSKRLLSLLLSFAGALLFIIGRQPYAAALVLMMLLIKALLLIKRP